MARPNEQWTVIVVTDHGQVSLPARGPVIADLVQAFLEVPPGPIGPPPPAGFGPVEIITEPLGINAIDLFW